MTRSESEHPCWRIIEGDCIDAMADMEPASVDAIVTDPPYGLGFMGRAWDALPPGVPWAQACLRVLKPGGHMLAFGGTRTAHRLVCAIEDAGFEIRDTIAWMYGEGFPKSLDVGKAIDKAAGAAREVVGTRPQFPDGDRGARPRPSKFPNAYGDGMPDPGRVSVTAPATPEAAEWDGWGTALKPAFEPIVVARKPLVGTVASNVLAHGTGALNVNGCRIPSGDDHREKCESVVGLDSNRNGTAYGEWKGERESSWSPAGRWPANVVLDEEAATMLDGQTARLHAAGNTPESTGGPATHTGMFGIGFAGPSRVFRDSGGASRFFYVAKTSSSERNAGLDGLEEHEQSAAYGDIGPVDGNPRKVNTGHVQRTRNIHPTVKPRELMRWLVRLVTPPGGTVLDPFTGSGTTGIAALREGFSFIGIEREAEYVAIARARIIGDAPLFNAGMEAA